MRCMTMGKDFFPVLWILLCLRMQASARADDVELASSNLPVMVIDTHGQTIVDQTRITADMKILWHEDGSRNHVTDTVYDYSGLIAIELRGSTAQQFPKKPYRFETQDSLGNNRNVNLIGMPRENDWILYNPYSDKTFLRNILAYRIARKMGRYATRTRLCEVVLNGDYQGIYVLMEKIKVDDDRVVIAEMDGDDTAGDSLTGGYIIKIDKSDGEQVGGWTSDAGTHYQYHYPKPDEILPEQKAYIQNFMDAFETAVLGGSYSDPENGYGKYIDLDSFVDLFILNEVSRNIDGYRLSAFMTKDRDSRGGKLVMGPAWDYNLSFGNGNYYMGEYVEGWNIVTLAEQTGGDFPPPFYWMTIFNEPAFLNRAVSRWQVLREDVLDIDTLTAWVDKMADSLDEAQRRNYERWPEVIGWYIWPNAFIGDSFDEEIEFFKEWIQGRILWMDEEVEAYLASVEPGPSRILPRTCVLYKNVPNPFNASTTLSYRIGHAGKVRLDVFNSRGQRIRTLFDGMRDQGEYTASWDGRTGTGGPAPAGVYFCRLASPAGNHVQKMLLIP
ncbi:CotH kinase family protein [bacterium]|nr:CotH kinase family protein [bacterium]